MTEKKTNKDEAEVFTFRITPTGDGRFFTWRKYDADGEEVEVGQQLFNSEPDAEKAVRSFISGKDVLAVDKMHSVDAEDNKHVVYETSQEEETTRNGAAIRHVEDASMSEGDNERPVDTSVTPAMEAVQNDDVSDVAGPAERTEAEQKAVDAAQAKSDERAEDAS